MDLNQLLSRHQIALMQAQSANDIAARTAHRGRAALYAEKISALGGKVVVMETIRA